MTPHTGLMAASKKKVLALPDLHFPFCDFKKLSLVYQIIKKEKPDVIVQLGDVLDMYSQARFARSHDIMTPKEEMLEGMECYRNFWETIKKLAPKAKLIQLGGNHTDRAIKMACDKAPELLPWLDVEKRFKHAGVEVHMDSRYELEINGVLYVHGWLSNSFAHARYFNKSVVHGHLHSALIHSENMHDRRLFSMSCGYLADPMQVPLLYRATKTTKWIHALGMVDEYGPRLIYL